MASEKKPSGPSWHKRLAKAETVLALAILSELLLNPWLFSLSFLTPGMKTLLKMALVVGLFGTLFKHVEKVIDGGLNVTRNATEWVSLPRVVGHTALLLVMFLAFYWIVNQSMPWSGAQVPSWAQGWLGKGRPPANHASL